MPRKAKNKVESLNSQHLYICVWFFVVPWYDFNKRKKKVIKNIKKKMLNDWKKEKSNAKII